MRNVIAHLNDAITMYISNGLRLYFRFTPVRMVRHEAIPKRPTIKSPLLIYFAVIGNPKRHQKTYRIVAQWFYIRNVCVSNIDRLYLDG